MVIVLHLAVQVTGRGSELFESGPSFEESKGREALDAEAETSGASVVAGATAPVVTRSQVLKLALLAAALRRQESAASARPLRRGILASGASPGTGRRLFFVSSGGVGIGAEQTAVQDGVVEGWASPMGWSALVRADLAQGSSAVLTGAGRWAAKSWSISAGASAFARTQGRLGGGAGSVAASSRRAAAARVAATVAASGVCRCRKSG